jgi:hypothetical protein
MIYFGCHMIQNPSALPSYLYIKRIISLLGGTLSAYSGDVEFLIERGSYQNNRMGSGGFQVGRYI